VDPEVAGAVHHRLRCSGVPPGVEVIGKPFELDVLALRAQAMLSADQQKLDQEPGT